MGISFRTETYKIGWQEALKTFKPANLGLLFLVSLRALKDLYKALMHAWFLPTALLAGLVLEWPGLVCAFYMILMLRAARPSIDLKKGHYWQHINFVDWVVFLGLLSMIDGVRSILYHRVGTLSVSLYNVALKSFFLGNNFSWLPGSDVLGIVTYFLSPFVIVWALFMLDARETVWGYVGAFGRAFLMMLYNYPFFLLSYMALRSVIALSYLGARPFMQASSYLPQLGWILLFAIVIPFYICFIMSFYIKQLHEQFGLYYKA